MWWDRKEKRELQNQLDSNPASPASLFLYFCSSGQPETDWVQRIQPQEPRVGTRQHGSIAWLPPTWRASRLSEIENAINNSQRLLGLIETPKTKPVLQRWVQFLMANHEILDLAGERARRNSILRFSQILFPLIRSIDLLCINYWLFAIKSLKKTISKEHVLISCVCGPWPEMTMVYLVAEEQTIHRKNISPKGDLCTNRTLKMNNQATKRAPPASEILTVYKTCI